jgi:dihydrofolate reductase
MKVSAIVAIDSKNGMGKVGGIPWHIPGEQKRFKDITTPHPMIMGRKTFTSIGKILPNRPHIIVTRDTSFQLEGATVVHSVTEAIQVAKQLEEERIKQYALSKEKEHNSLFIPHSAQHEVFIIGGGEIFREAMPSLTRIYLTVIQHDFSCDTFFPDYSDFTEVIEKEEHTEWEYPYTFLTLEKGPKGPDDTEGPEV